MNNINNRQGQMEEALLSFVSWDEVVQTYKRAVDLVFDLSDEEKVQIEKEINIARDNREGSRQKFEDAKMILD